MLGDFFKKQWVTYLDSFDHEAVAKTDCRPANVAYIGIALLAVIAAIGYVPFLRKATGLEHAVVPAILVIGGAIFSILTWLSYPNRTMVGVFQLFDSPLWTASLIATSVLSKPPVSYIFAGFFIAACLYYAMLYTANLLGTTAIMSGPLTAGLALGADTPIYLMIAAGAIAFVFWSRSTSEKRVLKARQERSEVVLKHIDNLLSRRVTGSTRLDQIPIRALLHDVKNELSFASWNLNFISLDKLNDEEKKVWENAKSGVLHAFSTAQDYFDKEKEGNIASQVFWLSDIPDAILETPSMKKSGERLVVRDFPDVVIRGSLELMVAAVRNLVDNALEAGAGRVAVEARKEEQGEFAVIEVSDNGPGLPEDVLRNIFSPFNTYGKERSVGLGIYLSRRIVDAVDGKLELVSTNSEGTSFRITLPITSSIA